MSRRTEVCFLIGAGGEVLWSDRSGSPSAMPDSRARWEAVWAHRDELAVIAHSHPHGPLAFSAVDETTMAALDAALGRPLRYAVVAPDGVTYRGPRSSQELSQEFEQDWVALLRDESGMVRRMAILNVTYAGRSADAKHLVDDGVDDADIRRIAVELIRGGGLTGMAQLDVARDVFRHFVVDRHRDPDGTLRIYLRPKVPFGSSAARASAR